MPALPKISKDYRFFIKETNDLLDILRKSKQLHPMYQRLIAEVVLIKLSFLMDNISERIFVKLVAGAAYNDGTNPMLLQTANTIQNAKILLGSFGRAKSLIFFRWTDADAYRDMIRYVFDPSDHCFNVITAHGTTLKELKIVRNYVAHKSGSAKTKFQNVIRTHYGARVRTVDAGQFLIAKRLRRTRPPTPIHWYTLAAQIFMKELTRS